MNRYFGTHSQLIPVERQRAPDLDETDEAVGSLQNLLCLHVIGNISIIVDSSGVVSGSPHHVASSGNQDHLVGPELNLSDEALNDRHEESLVLLNFDQLGKGHVVPHENAIYIVEGLFFEELLVIRGQMKRIVIGEVEASAQIGSYFLQMFLRNLELPLLVLVCLDCEKFNRHDLIDGLPRHARHHSSFGHQDQELDFSRGNHPEDPEELQGLFLFNVQLGDPQELTLEIHSADFHEELLIRVVDQDDGVRVEVH